VQDADQPAQSHRPKTSVSRRTTMVLLAALAVVAVVEVTVLVHRRAALQESSAGWVATVLFPTAALLRENQQILNELQTQSFVESGNGLLESYLVRIRRDGVAKNAEMKQRLDQLAENNTAVVTLIKAYAPHAKTPVFTAEGDKFRNYASAWRDRWNSVMELFMAGGNYAASEVLFPKDFPAAVDAEIAAAQ
jgi:hypothetical protein